MCGLWKEGLADAMGSLAFGLIGGLAKFSFSALRLPGNKNHLYFVLINKLYNLERKKAPRPLWSGTCLIKKKSIKQMTHL